MQLRWCCDRGSAGAEDAAGAEEPVRAAASSPVAAVAEAVGGEGVRVADALALGDRGDDLVAGLLDVEAVVEQHVDVGVDLTRVEEHAAVAAYVHVHAVLRDLLHGGLVLRAHDHAVSPHWC